MSSSQIAKTAKEDLAKLVQAVEPVIQEHLNNMEPAVIDYIMTNYKEYLKLNLEKDFEVARSANLKQSPFDDIIEDYNNG